MNNAVTSLGAQQWAFGYGAALLALLAIDALWLTFYMGPAYKAALGDLLLAQPRLASAAAFYLLFAVGVVVFAVAPALRADSWQTAAMLGGLLGLVAYRHLRPDQLRRPERLAGRTDRDRHRLGRPVVGRRRSRRLRGRQPLRLIREARKADQRFQPRCFAACSPCASRVVPAMRASIASSTADGIALPAWRYAPASPLAGSVIITSFH